MIRILMLILALTVFTPSGFADEGWPLVTRDLIGQHNRRPVSAFDMVSGNPFLISLVDHLTLQVRGWSAPIPGSRVISVLARSGDFRSPAGHPRPLRLTYWDGPTSAPLAVYLPGIFQGAGDDDTHRMVDMLREAGYRVLVVPDPLGFEYMANDPVEPPAAYPSEARIVRDAVGEVLRTYGGTRARVIAASHGAFLASVVWALDQAEPTQVIEDVSLLFPQADLGHAMDLIDGYVGTNVTDDAPRALVGSVFRGALRRLVKRLQRTYLRDAAAGFRARVYEARAARALRTYRRSVAGRDLNFRRVLGDYVARPDVLARFGGPEGRLLTWAERGHAVRGATSIRLIVSTDDWTNAPDAWTGVPDWLTDEARFAVIERAGHAGLVAESWFRRAIFAAMSAH